MRHAAKYIDGLPCVQETIGNKMPSADLEAPSR